MTRAVSDRVLVKYDRFAAGLSGDTPAAFVLGAERAHGLAVTRSLGRRGIPVVMLGRSATPGMCSRYGFPVPLDVPIDRFDANELVDMLCRLGEKLPVPGVLLATGDLHVLLLARNQARLARWFRFAIPELEILEALADKRTQYELAAQCGIATPRTLSPADVGDLDQVARDIGFPCIVKPALSQVWLHHQMSQGLVGLNKLSVVNTQAELLREYTQMTAGQQGVVIQELIPGDADQLYAVYAYSPTRDNAEGQPGGLAPTVFIRRELRDWPVNYGNGSYSTGVLDPEVESLGRKFLACTRYRGLANIEFKRDARDGTLKLIEFNVRAASQLALAIDSGVDLPHAAYADLAGIPVDAIPMKPVREGIRWIDLGADTLSGHAHRRHGGPGILSWIRDVLRARSYAFFAADDLRPALARMAELLRALRDSLVAHHRQR